MWQEERQKELRKQQRDFGEKERPEGAASLEPGKERTECHQPPPERPPGNHSCMRGLLWVSMLSPGELIHPHSIPGVDSRAASFLEAGGDDPCPHSFGWLAEFVSSGCRTDVLFSCWSSAEHHSHFLEDLHFLKCGPLPPSSKQPVVG